MPERRQAALRFLEEPPGEGAVRRFAEGRARRNKISAEGELRPLALKPTQWPNPCGREKLQLRTSSRHRRNCKRRNPECSKARDDARARSRANQAANHLPNK